MQLHGLSNLNLDYLRVIRHMGLTDAKVMLRYAQEKSLDPHKPKKNNVENKLVNDSMSMPNNR